MSLRQTIQCLLPFVRPYRRLVIATLQPTLVGSPAAQGNPFVLRYTVGTVQGMLNRGEELAEGWMLLAWVSRLLLGKEIINTFIQFGRRYHGEKIRIQIFGVSPQLLARKTNFRPDGHPLTLYNTFALHQESGLVLQKTTIERAPSKKTSAPATFLPPKSRLKPLPARTSSTTKF